MTPCAQNPYRVFLEFDPVAAMILGDFGKPKLHKRGDSMTKLTELSEPTMQTAPGINWDDLTFSFTPTKSMYLASCDKGGEWEEGRMAPFGNLSLSPAACVLNYGQGLFEGLKAQRTKTNGKGDGNIVLFRPIENGLRLARGAARMCIPPFPPERFVTAVKETVLANEEFVPPHGKGALYIRPLLLGTGPVLGVNPSPSYTFVVYTSPVGPYFKGGLEPIRLELTTKFHRAAAGGTGEAKTICNYAGTMYPASLARKSGFAEVIYLDSTHNRFIDEVGAANFFCVLGDTLVTPRLSGSILPGITRMSIMQFAEEILKMKVEERDIDYEEALTAQEAFCAGTAAVVSPIGSITVGDTEHVFNEAKVGPVTQKIYNTLTEIAQGVRDDPFDWVVPVK